jgi:hypothetical protein
MGSKAASSSGGREEPVAGKRLCALIGALLLALFTVSALASAAAGDYAKGRGTTVQERFSFTAQGTGLADRANGSSVHTFTVFDPNITIKGDVTCMIIIGKDAFIGGRITDVKPAGVGPVIASQGFGIFAEDNAKPSSGLDLYGYTTFPQPVTDCAEVVASGAFGNNVITGDVEIIPGTP